MTDDIRSQPNPDAREDQRAEQDRLDEDAEHLIEDDPGDPRDRLPLNEEDRLLQQTTYRELHP
jgi:hypothetical protein